MTQNYLSGRVSRFAVGVPGFSTSGDLTLDVSGALGIGTTQPRAEADVPNISIREQILDSVGETGPLGYYLSVDTNGVRWAQPNPTSLNSIRLYEDGVQVGFNSANGLNFISPDEFFVDLSQNPGDPNLADITFNPGWVKIGYATTTGELNYGLSTSFGPDGTFWSLPGFGTSEASGITSIGIGTNNPQADLQVGIGSTGVTLGGVEGRVKGQIGEFKTIVLDGNLSAKSLLIDPGFSTFIGPIDAQGVSTFSADVDVNANFFATEIETVSIAATNATAGILTVGIDSTSQALDVIGEVDILGFTTTTGNVFIAGILTVTERFDVPNIGVEYLTVSGIATINEMELNSGIATELSVGLATVTELNFDVGLGSTLNVGLATVGVATIQYADIVRETVAISSVTEQYVGYSTITYAETGISTIGFASIGYPTSDAFADESLFVNGKSTFTGFVTFTDDIYVSGFGTFGEGVDIPFVQTDQLVVTGIATINQVEFNVGIGTTLSLVNINSSGIGTFNELEAQNIVSAGASIGGIDFPGAGEIAGDNLDFDTGRIGILTGDLINYGIGTITNLSGELAGITTVQGINLRFSGDSDISGVGFNTQAFGLNDGIVTIPGNLSVRNESFPIIGTAAQIKLGDVDNDPTVGLTTVAGTLYAGKDVIARGSLISRSLGVEFLTVTGISTINELEYAVGVGTTANIEELNVGVASVANAGITSLNADFINAGVITARLQLESDFAVIRGDTSLLRVESPTDPNFTDARIETPKLKVEDVLRPGTGFAVIENLNVPFIGTIADFRSPDSKIGIASIGIATVGYASITDAYVGVSTIGLASVTDIESGTINVRDASIGISTVGYTSIGVGNTLEGAMYVVGVNTFVGFSTFTGDIFVDGDFTVSGIFSSFQLDAAQSQIGILTTATLIDSNGLLDAENVAISTNLTVTGLSSFVGFTTTNDVIVGGGLTVVGDTRFLGIVSITDTSFVNQEVTGISTVNELNFNVGFGTTLTVGFLTVTDAIVSGVATFNGNIDINANVDIEGKVVVDGDFGVIGVSTFTNTETIGVATFNNINQPTGVATLSNSILGVTSVGFATITDTYVGVATIGIADIEVLDLENLNVSGVSTFVGLATFGNIEYVNSVSTGIASFNQTGTGIASVGFATVTNAWIGISSIDFANIGLGASTEPALNVEGTSELLGFTTFRGDVFVGGALTVTGIASYGQLDAQQSNIGILTVKTDLDVEGTFSVIGFSTLGDFEANSGVITSLNIGFATVTGILTTNQLEIENDLVVKRNLQVNGITTLGAPGPTGFTTVRGDLYVDGDLFVRDDIFKDEISGRNANFTGITTTNIFEFGIGVGNTSLNVNGSLNFFTGIGTDLTVNNIFVSSTFADLNNVRINGITTAANIDARVGIVTVSQLDASIINSQQINNSGIITTLNLTAYNDITAELSLRSNGTLGVRSEATFEDDVFINGGNLTLTPNAGVGGTISAFDVQSSYLAVSAASTLSGNVNIDAVTVQIAGITTINNSLKVTGVVNIDSQITSPLGIITTLSGSSLTYDTAGIGTVTAGEIGVGTVTADLVTVDRLDVTQTSQLGIATANTLRVLTVADFDQVNVNTGFTTTSNVDTLNVNSGVATTFQVNDLLTSTNNDFTNLTVGLATVTGQLEHTINATVTDAARTSGSGTVTLFTVPSGFTSADFTITAVEGSNFQTVKIHALNTGSAVFHNEYSDLFNNGEVSTFDVVGGAGQMVLVASSISGNSVTYTTHLVAHKS